MQVTGIFLNLPLLALFIALSYGASLPVWFGLPYMPMDNPFYFSENALGFGVDATQLLWWVLAFVLVDFAFYWFHRSAHMVNLLWATHVVHHSSEDYNLTVGLRHSSIENLFSALFYIPMAVLGMPWQMFLIVYSLNLLHQFWVHTKLIKHLGWLELVFSTPSHHRVHHARNPKYIDRNFGGTLIIWDRLFGTFKQEEDEPVYGITTPIQALNPMTVNLHAFRDLFAWLPQMRSLGDKLRFLFRAPGWFPAYLGGPKAVPEPAPNHVVYNPSQRVHWLAFAILHFLLVLYTTDELMHYVAQPGAAWGYTLFWVTMLVWSCANIGGLLDNSRWAWVSEALRHTAILIISGRYLLTDVYPLPNVAAIFGGALLSFALLWAFRFWDNGDLQPRQVLRRLGL
jgi:sterol desaturase/sphingolipid hydroxylase (fatty acid hydroxylase superfamily)